MTLWVGQSLMTVLLWKEPFAAFSWKKTYQLARLALPVWDRTLIPHFSGQPRRIDPAKLRYHGFAPHQVWPSTRPLATGRPCLSDASRYRHWHLPWPMCRHNAGMIQLYFHTPSLPGWKKVVLSEKVEACRGAMLLRCCVWLIVLRIWTRGFGMDELPKNAFGWRFVKHWHGSIQPFVCLAKHARKLHRFFCHAGWEPHWHGCIFSWNDLCPNPVFFVRQVMPSPCGLSSWLGVWTNIPPDWKPTPRNNHFASKRFIEMLRFTMTMFLLAWMSENECTYNVIRIFHCVLQWYLFK